MKKLVSYSVSGIDLNQIKENVENASYLHHVLFVVVL